MSDLLLDQFSRLLDSLGEGEQIARLEESGFLDLLRGEADGGAGASLEDFFPLVLAAGTRPGAGAVIHTIVARTGDAKASCVEDCEAALKLTGIGAERAKATAAAVTAGLMAGAMQQLLDMTLQYAGLRRQFGREIGRFQAIQHQIAVMAEEVMAARMSVQIAFQGSGLADILLQRAAAAKLRAGQAALIVGPAAHAVHGAIGISEEFGLHKFTGALQRGRLAHGGESYWARKLGHLALARSESLATLARIL